MSRLKVFATWLWLAVPLCVLVVSQLAHRPTDLELQRSLAVSLPENESVLLGLADALHAAGRDAEALEYAERIVAAQPDSEMGHRVLLGLYGNLGRRDEALRAFGQLVRLDKVIPSDLVGAGVLVQAGNPAWAIELYTRALEIEPDNLEAHINLGALFVDTRHWNSARTHLEHALEISPQNIPALLNLGILERRVGRPRFALIHFQEVLRLAPEHSLARELRDEILAQLDSRS